MTEKQRRFALEFAARGNGTDAARRAGYSPTSAHSTASDLLKLPHVQAEIERLRSDLSASALAILKAAQPKAARRLLRVIEEGKDRDAVAAARDILRGVIVPVERVEVEVTTLSQMILQLKRAEEAALSEETQGTLPNPPQPLTLPPGDTTGNE